MKIGIVWLPNIGKSTLFNALTKSYSAPAENFPFCTIEPNVGIVEVKDARVDALSQMSNTQKKIYAAIEFVDIAGLVKWAWEGAGLGNKFLSHIREVDAIVQVLRHFQDNDVTHVEWPVDPLRDMDIINTELIFADLQQIEKALPAIEKKAKTSKDILITQEYEALAKVHHYLWSGQWLHGVLDAFTPKDHEHLRKYNFLSMKPIVYAINIGQDDIGRAPQIAQEFAAKLRSPCVCVCAKLESEMIEFNADERKEYIDSLVEKSQAEHIPTLDDLIALAFKTVGLMYYFTTGEKETRAWTVPIGSTAPEAAGAIHTDFVKGFIKAEVVSCDKLLEAGSRWTAREKWFFRLEWKEYIVQDGDVIVFKING